MNAFAAKTVLGDALQAQNTELRSAGRTILQASFVQPALFALPSCVKLQSAQFFEPFDIVT